MRKIIIAGFGLGAWLIIVGLIFTSTPEKALAGIGGLGSRPVVANLTLTTSPTEYSYTFPTSVGNISIQSRTAADFKMATTAAASGSTYFTVKSGTVYQVGPLNSSDRTLYFQSANSGQVIEFVYWY